jgi:hypothetical protein
MHPEALFAADGKNEIYLLSDDGSDICKDRECASCARSHFVAFRLTWL